MIAWAAKQIGLGKLYMKSDINDKKVGVKLSPCAHAINIF